MLEAEKSWYILYKHIEVYALVTEVHVMFN